jgi:hypothetical protein
VKIFADNKSTTVAKRPLVLNGLFANGAEKSEIY